MMIVVSCYGREFDYARFVDWTRRSVLLKAIAVTLPTPCEAIVDRLQSVSVSGKRAIGCAAERITHML